MRGINKIWCKKGEKSKMKKKALSIIILLTFCIVALSGCNNSKDVTVVCWGDSMTEGVAGNGVTYPDELAKLSGYNVVNMGGAGESLITIAARSGAMKIIVDEDFEVPASRKAVYLTLTTRELYDDNDYAGKIAPCNTDRGGWTPAVIQIDEKTKIEGKLYTTCMLDENNVRTLSSAQFVRSEAGKAIVVPGGSEISVAAHDMIGDINIYWAGTNLGWDDTDLGGDAVKPENIIVALKKMILENTGVEFSSKEDVLDKEIPEGEKFIVIGMTTGDSKAWPGINEALAEEFGDKFIDAKAYLATRQALSDAKVEPTEKDMEYIEAGRIPFSLLGGYRYLDSPGKADEVHLNGIGYKLLAEQIYKRMKALGY